MRRSDEAFDRWYLRLLALYFVTLCGISSARYIWLDISGNGEVSLLTQLICFGCTFSAAAYFYRPKLGHRLLVVCAVTILLLRGPSGPPEAAAFWFLVASVLALPWLVGARVHLTL